MRYSTLQEKAVKQGDIKDVGALPHGLAVRVGGHVASILAFVDFGLQNGHYQKCSCFVKEERFVIIEDGRVGAPVAYDDRIQLHGVRDIADVEES